MRFQTTKRPLTRVLSIPLISVAVLATITLISTDSSRQAEAAPDGEQTSHADDDHERYEAVLKKTMAGRVDIYFDVAELEAESPRLAGMKSSGLVDITGKHLLCFADAEGNMWLVDPDTVLTYRIRQLGKANK